MQALDTPDTVTAQESTLLAGEVECEDKYHEKPLALLDWGEMEVPMVFLA